MNNSHSEIGLGCVTFGREIDEPASFAVLDHAYANGITFFDTAAAYGNGASETILGKWMAKRGKTFPTITVATKVLPPFDSQHITASVEQSLVRLQCRVIDILYLHRWDAALQSPEAFAALDGLVRSGKVRQLGASNFTAEQLKDSLHLQQTHGYEPFRFVQNNHNLAVSDVGENLKKLCQQKAVAIISYSPLGAGFLTGKHQQGTQEGSRFAIMPGHQDVYYHEAAYRRLKKLHKVAARTGYPPVQLALAWAIHQPGIATVLIGGRSPAHIDQALQARDFNEPELFAELESA